MCRLIPFANHPTPIYTSFLTTEENETEKADEWEVPMSEDVGQLLIQCLFRIGGCLGFKDMSSLRTEE
jgi:hypothetical protein